MLGMVSEKGIKVINVNKKGCEDTQQRRKGKNTSKNFYELLNKRKSTGVFTTLQHRCILVYTHIPKVHL